MANDSINFVTDSNKETSTNRLLRIVKHTTSIVFKGRVANRNGGLSSPFEALIIEHQAEQAEVKAEKVNNIAVVSAPTAHAHALSLPDLSEDLAVLAAQNKAFKEGLLRLQALDLDEDLFIEAIEALRRRYYGRRTPIMKRYQGKLHDEHSALHE